MYIDLGIGKLCLTASGVLRDCALAIGAFVNSLISFITCESKTLVVETKSREAFHGFRKKISLKKQITVVAIRHSVLLNIKFRYHFQNIDKNFSEINEI